MYLYIYIRYFILCIVSCLQKNTLFLLRALATYPVDVAARCGVWSQLTIKVPEGGQMGLFLCICG